MKFRLYLLIALSAIISIIFSCSHDDLDQPVIDYRCVVKTTATGEKIYANNPTPVFLSIQKKDTDVGNYKLSYNIQEGKGDLFVNDEKLAPGDQIPIKLEKLSIYYIPTSLGEHQLKFKFENEEYYTESIYTANASDLIFIATTENLPKKLLVDKPIAFDLNIKQKEESETEEFNARLSILKGEGYVRLVNDNKNEKDSLSFNIKPQNPATRANNQYKVKIGNNKLNYFSSEKGENLILLQIENEHGYSQDINLPLNIELPNFRVVSSNDSIASVGTVNNFTLSIEDCDNFTDNIYNVSYRNLKNSGKLKINANEINVGTTIQLEKGEHICEFIPVELGATALEFIVRDKYNTVKKDTAIFDTKRSYVNIQVSDHDSIATIFDSKDISISIDKINYTGKYFLDLSQNPAGSAKIKINGIDYSGGRIEITNPHNTLINFIPQKINDFKLIAKVYDDYGSESVAEIPFKVINSSGSIRISNHNPMVSIFSQTYFNFSIVKANYSGSYQYEIQQISPDIFSGGGNFGQIKVNGKEYGGGKMVVDNSNNTTVTFSPQEKGDVILRLKIFDDFGGELTEDLNFSVNNTDIKLSVTDLNKELILSQPTEFTLIPTKPFYENQDLFLKITQEPILAGTIKVNGQIYFSEFVMVENNSPVRISYTPLKEGPVNLLLNATDKWGSSANYPVTFQVSNPPIRLETMNFVSTTSLNTENILNFIVSKENYNNEFNYNITTTPNDAGIIKINDEIYDKGLSLLQTPDATKLSFTPSISGDITLTLTIKDKVGGIVKRNFLYKVNNPKLLLSLGSIEDDLTLNKRTSFNFSVNKADYQGKFYYEIETENCNEIKVGGSIYLPGNRLEIPNQENTTVSFIPTSVGRDIVKLKLRIYDDWGGIAERHINFSVTNSDISLETANVETSQYVGRESNFSFTAYKPGYEGKLKYEIKVTPSGIGTLKIDGKDYISSQIEMESNAIIPVTFIPLKEGEANLKIIITDEFSGEKSKSFSCQIDRTDIMMEIADFVSNTYINTDNVFSMALSKLYYTGNYNCSISTIPANAGTIKINDIIYTGGKLPVPDPANTKFSFKPNIEGEIDLVIHVTDNTGGQKSKTITYKVANNPIDITVNNQKTGLIVNESSSFNFAVNKKNYSGKYQCEIICDPVDAGILKVNGQDYKGGIIEVANPNNTQVTLSPKVIGDIKMTIRAYDSFGGNIDKELNFSVANSDFKIIVSNQEKDIYNGLKTIFNFGTLKQNYNGSYLFEIIQMPENAGDLQVNGTAYSGGKIQLTEPALSTVTYTSHTTGSNTLTIKVFDEFGGSTQENVVFNCISSEVNIRIAGKEDNLVYNTPTSVNAIIIKEKYSGTFRYEIEQLPANSGNISVDGQPYLGGLQSVLNPDNLQISFTPTREGYVTLKLTIQDQIGGKAEKLLKYEVTNPDIVINLTEPSSDILVDAESNFNFSVSKANYEGKFFYQITQQPDNNGIIKANGNIYNGARTLITDLNNNPISYTANKPGAVTLRLVVQDEWGKEITRLVNYSVSNSDIKIDISEKEYDLSLNKSTQIKFKVSKPNYNGPFEAMILQDPEASGTLKLNGLPYHSEDYIEINSENTIEFIPGKTGATLLKVIVKDEHNGQKEIALNFNVTNPLINLTVSNKEEDVIYSTPTSFNTSITKDHYNGTFDYEIEQIPANSGNITVDGKAYTGGIQPISNPQNLHISFTPTKIGRISLVVRVKDKVGGIIEKTLDFNVTNPGINLNITNKESQLTYKKSTAFNVAISKQAYTGEYTYEILQNPAAAGVLTVDNKPYSGGIQNVTNPNNLQVGFTPTKEGYITLRIKVSDNTGLTVEENISFYVVNAPVVLTLNQPTDKNINIGEITNFTFKATKEGYSGEFSYEIIPYPINSGVITVNGKNELSGRLSSNPATVSFTPEKTGTTILNVKISDTEGKTTEKQIDFNISNTPISISFSNNEESIVLNNPTNFVFSVLKANYPDNKNINYSISPAYNGTLLIDGKPYAGTTASVPYAKIKNGLQVQYIPDREGSKGLTFTATDEYAGVTNSSLMFNVANPELSLFLTGVNTNAANEASLGSTYKFYYNINKAHYSDDFSYWITLDPAACGIVGTSDVTPRSKINRSGNGVQMETGSITNNPNGTVTGEIRFTPSSPDYLNQEITVNVRVRDKWNNEKEQSVRFRIVTTAIEVNVHRQTSINVEEPYTFFFTVNKNNYSGKFKYSLVGLADGDRIETSQDGKSWSIYNGGKFDLPNKDHTYLRYTPANIGTVPMRLFVYDETNTEAMQELTFDVKAPDVRITTDARSKQGYLEQFVPFQIIAEEDKKENMSVSFSIDNPDFSGELKFNDSPIIASNPVLRATPSVFSVASGSKNKLEIMSRKKNSWSVTTTATNRWQKSASISTNIDVNEKPRYILAKSVSGNGTVSVSPDQTNYESGTNVTLTAIAKEGWNFVGWKGDATGTDPTITVTMDKDKNIQAVFEQNFKIGISCLNIAVEEGLTASIELEVYNGVGNTKKHIQTIICDMTSEVSSKEYFINPGQFEALTFIVKRFIWMNRPASEFEKAYVALCPNHELADKNGASSESRNYQDGLVGVFYKKHHWVQDAADYGRPAVNQIVDLTSMLLVCGFTLF